MDPSAIGRIENCRQIEQLFRGEVSRTALDFSKDSSRVAGFSRPEGRGLVRYVAVATVIACENLTIRPLTHHEHKTPNCGSAVFRM